MTVDNPLPMAASVMATSGAAKIKYITDANKLTAPAAIIAVVSFLPYTAVNANMIMAKPNTIDMMINSIFPIIFYSESVSLITFSFSAVIEGFSASLSMTVLLLKGILI